MPRPEYLTIASSSPPLTVTALRGMAPPVPAGGYGGWSTIARPRRKALTQWDGIDPVRELVPLLLDGWPSSSVEPDCRSLERMAQPATPGGEPPTVQVTGAIPHAALAWVIEDLEWDQQPLYSRSGFRVRQAVVVHLLEYVADDRLAIQPAAARARSTAAQKTAAAARAGGKTGPSGPRLYTVKQGDTLSGIAAHQLGSYKRWPEIADLNDIRDPRSITPGQKLRLP